MLGEAYQTNCVVTMNMLRNTLELGEPRNWMGIHCELDGNTLETTRMQKILPPFLPKRKKLGLLCTCYDFSLAEQNFYSEFCASHILA